MRFLGLLLCLQAAAGIRPAPQRPAAPARRTPTDAVAARVLRSPMLRPCAWCALVCLDRVDVYAPQLAAVVRALWAAFCELASVREWVKSAEHAESAQRVTTRGKDPKTWEFQQLHRYYGLLPRDAVEAFQRPFDKHRRISKEFMRRHSLGPFEAATGADDVDALFGGRALGTKRAVQSLRTVALARAHAAAQLGRAKAQQYEEDSFLGVGEDDSSDDDDDDEEEDDAEAEPEEEEEDDNDDADADDEAVDYDEAIDEAADDDDFEEEDDDDDEAPAMNAAPATTPQEAIDEPAGTGPQDSARASARASEDRDDAEDDDVRLEAVDEEEEEEDDDDATEDDDPNDDDSDEGEDDVDDEIEFEDEEEEEDGFDEDDEDEAIDAADDEDADDNEDARRR
ncbi:hypothetical protein M885DRAFT_590553 [Pelagophyceae sp. CCMP2097]|nr:hypothetical protein M885DRAFT_590553 [Pelagophyceae sp. CCMP2097]